jgi:putative Tad-like protein involved in Flp pilus assembly
MSKVQFLSARTQLGQAVVLVALMIMVIIGAVGLAVDGGIAYYYNASAERAAAAAALSGVVFMPAQFTPASAIPAASGNDATDRAMVAAARNTYPISTAISCTATTCSASGANGITVAASIVAGFDNKLSVTVTRTVNTFFMQIFGIGTFNISRTAIATYLPPLKLGQPGGIIGSTVSQLGSGGHFYFLRTEGYGTDRGQGDAYTPNCGLGGFPGCNGSGCAACPSNDVHQISANAGTDFADPTLPFNGGYNFMVTVPVGSTAQIQVYNAAFAPDGNNGGPNFCENWQAVGPPALTAGHLCSSGGNYYYHEDDCCSFNYGTANTYSAMKYTIFNAPSVFIRSTDTPISQMLVKPIDASNFGAGTPNYKDVNTNKIVNQKFSGANGSPTNLTIYHGWTNVGGYFPDTNCLVAICAAGEEPESQLITYTPGKGPIPNLGPGTYRLRIDTLEYNGANPCNNNGTICNGVSYAHKGMSVRVTDGTGVNPCGGCTMSALDDIAIFTPIAVPGGSSFPLPIFQLPPDYAGQTVAVDIFDAGDMSGSGQIYLGLIDPTTNALLVEPNGNPAANVYDLGPQRSNYPASATLIGTYGNPNPVEQIVANGGTLFGDNKWYHYDVPIPATYNPGLNPNNWWWSLNYRTTANVTAADTITITLNLKGNPAHLVQS